MNIKNHSSNWLKYLVYDNCCNTKQYILQNLKQITPRAQMNYLYPTNSASSYLKQFHISKHLILKEIDPNLKKWGSKFRLQVFGKIQHKLS